MNFSKLESQSAFRKLTKDEISLVNGGGTCEGLFKLGGMLVGGVIGGVLTGGTVGTLGGAALGHQAGDTAGQAFCS